MVKTRSAILTDNNHNDAQDNGDGSKFGNEIPHPTVVSSLTSWITKLGPGHVKAIAGQLKILQPLASLHYPLYVVSHHIGHLTDLYFDASKENIKRAMN